MRGRVYKKCSKCGLMAKSNRQARCHNEECQHVFEKSQKTNKKKVSKKRKKSGSNPTAKKSRLADELFFDQDLFKFDATNHKDTANGQTFEIASLFDGLQDNGDKNDFEKTFARTTV